MYGISTGSGTIPDKGVRHRQRIRRRIQINRYRRLSRFYPNRAEPHQQRGWRTDVGPFFHLYHV